MLRRTGLLLAILLQAGSLTAIAAFQVRVKGTDVNLRAGDSLTREVVTQVDRGDILTATTVSGDWIAVKVPGSVGLWVHREFIDENHTVSAKTLNVRGGAGINFSIVGKLKRDDQVSIRKRMGEWVQIEPPEEARLWIHNTLVEVLKRPDAVPPPEPETVVELVPDPPVPVGTPRPVLVNTPEKPPVAVPEPVETVEVNYPPPPADIRKMGLVPLVGQGKPGEFNGTLRYVTTLLVKRPSGYRLIDERRAQPVTLCFVRGNRDQLSKLTGQTMSISGPVYWVQGVRQPVIVPKTIQPE